MLIRDIRTQFANSSSSQREPITLSALKDQNFTHAAFNETGDLLFAWAYGQRDTLYVWRCQDHVIGQATESESRYETVNSYSHLQFKLHLSNSLPGKSRRP
jgi:hypothetical protein